jgi:hypothetical protein
VGARQDCTSDASPSAYLAGMKVLRGWTDGPMSVALTRDDVTAINNALNEVLHGPDAIDAVEFHTRIGVTREAAMRLLEEVGATLNDDG